MTEDGLHLLRRQALAARRAMPPELRETASRRIASTAIRCGEFQAARTLACYLPMTDEADPGRIISRAWSCGKRVCVPVTGPGRSMVFGLLEPDTLLRRNDFGLFEPSPVTAVAPTGIDLVITPLVAFDRYGHRIGMGGGYYDRAFAFLRRRRFWFRPRLVGIAFDCQQVAPFEPNPWDVPVTSVITESGRLVF